MLISCKPCGAIIDTDLVPQGCVSGLWIQARSGLLSGLLSGRTLGRNVTPRCCLCLLRGFREKGARAAWRGAQAAAGAQPEFIARLGAHPPPSPARAARCPLACWRRVAQVSRGHQRHAGPPSSPAARTRCPCGQQSRTTTPIPHRMWPPSTSTAAKRPDRRRRVAPERAVTAQLRRQLARHEVERPLSKGKRPHEEALGLTLELTLRSPEELARLVGEEAAVAPRVTWRRAAAHTIWPQLPLKTETEPKRRCGAVRLHVPVHRLHRPPEDQGRDEPRPSPPPRCARAERAASRAERLARARPLERRERGAQVQGDVHEHDRDIVVSLADQPDAWPCGVRAAQPAEQRAERCCLVGRGRWRAHKDGVAVRARLLQSARA
eukprot:scaffold14478_cov73-Phaeocystis_antarctica.AAC.3